MKTAAKNKGGRPRLPPDQKRTKPLFVLMTPGEHQDLVELARQNARSLSEEVVRRLHATLQRPDWEDFMELLANNVRTAVRVLVEHGWRNWDDPRYGRTLLAPGSTLPPGGPVNIRAQLTLGQAAKLTRLGKTTLARAIAEGRLSATRRDDGGYLIDFTELERVFSIRATPATGDLTEEVLMCPDCGGHMSEIARIPLAEVKTTEAGRRHLREMSKAKTAKAERSFPKASKVSRRAGHARQES